MVRGKLPFFCSECNKKFIAIDMELAASVLSQPVKCPRCGSWHTRPWSPLPKMIADLRYKSIWEAIDKREAMNN